MKSGISTKERVTVVAGVIVNADKELSSVEEGVQSIIADYVPEGIPNKEALEHVEKATDSKPVHGEDLTQSNGNRLSICRLSMRSVS